ncbi:MAG: response regulator [Lachnospiraceae bacterium]|nr:response regulator [Lachnospiraceae bacterium]
MAGRKPKPTAVKELEGNPGKRKLNKKEPKPEKGMPECPEWLMPEVLQAHWNGDESSKKYLSKLEDSSRFLMFLLNNAIELANLEKGLVTLKESLANADRFFEMMDAIIEGTMKERNLHFSRNIHMEHLNVMCDTMKLRTIFLNVLSNSIKYTPSGGCISLNLEEIPSDKEGYALYKSVISDTGIGMPVVKKLVELMGGSITVESTLGKGTSVTVILPHRIVERDELLKLTKLQSDIPIKMIEDKRILLAEDNDLNAEIAMMILSDIGFICEHVIDGTEAVAAIENKPEGYYDLILMDIQMPILDGYKATRIIRQIEGEKSQIPILAMTANVMEEDKRMALAAGMNGHIAKPIDVDRLMDVLFSVIE